MVSNLIVKLDIDKQLKKHNWTASFLAERLGVHSSQISLWKQRERVDLKLVAKLMEVFDCEFEELFTVSKKQ